MTKNFPAIIIAVQLIFFAAVGYFWMLPNYLNSTPEGF